MLSGSTGTGACEQMEVNKSPPRVAGALAVSRFDATCMCLSEAADPHVPLHS